MAILGRFDKQPGESLDYEFDYTDWLADRSDTISGVPDITAELISTPGETGGELTISGTVVLGGIVRYFASGGLNGERFKVTCVATTVGGRIKEDEMAITIKET